MTDTPSVDQLRSLFSYEPKTGRLIWKPRGVPFWDAQHAGRRAGWVRPDGYWAVSVHRRNYGASRIVWALVYGEWPTKQIDHIDRDPLNNRICNLREATPPLNCANQGARKNNKLGVKGVYWCSTKKKYKAQIQFDGNKRHIGYYTSLKAAASAYKKVSILLNDEFSCTSGAS
jgi:hypothetical protein